jgi:hypothetical protein
MSQALPTVYLVRHGETAWTISGQHTGRTDIPLTERGEREAQALSARLKGMSFTKVLTSPLQRARRTAELAGFAECAQADPDLMEWDYGAYEGRRTSDIQAKRPGWRLFEDGCPGGETLEHTTLRFTQSMCKASRCCRIPRATSSPRYCPIGLITARTNRAGCWHCRIPLASMQRASYYAYRVGGTSPNGRFEWHWFDRDKILLDPYARSVSPATRG